MLGAEEAVPSIPLQQEQEEIEKTKLVALTFEKAGPLGIKLSSALVIERIEAHGLAIGCGLMPGDILIEVGGKSVAGFDLDQIVDLLSRRPVAVTFSRGGPPKENPSNLTSNPAAAVSNFGSKMFSWGRSFTAKSLEVANDVTKKTSEFAEKQGLSDLGNKATQVVSDLGTKATDLGAKVGSATQQSLKDVGSRVGTAAQQARDEGLGKAVGSVAQDTIDLTTKVTKHVVDITVDVSKKTAEVAVDVGKKTAEHADVIVQGFKESMKADALENAKLQEMMATEVTGDNVRSYLVDNSELCSPNLGLGFRVAPSLGMTDPDEKVAAWGSIVKGVPCENEWLKLGPQVYLPIMLVGKLVLKEQPAVSGDRESPSCSPHLVSESIPTPITSVPPNSGESFKPVDRVAQSTDTSLPVSSDRVRASAPEVSPPAPDVQLQAPTVLLKTTTTTPVPAPAPSMQPTPAPPEAQSEAPKRRALV